jgi:hypothetical protein
MGQYGGTRDDFAAHVELSIQLPRPGLKVRKGSPGFFLPFFFFCDPVLESFARPVHRPLPLLLTHLK